MPQVTHSPESVEASIIIATHNRLGDLRELLESLEVNCAAPPRAEIIVVDDASTDGTPAALAEGFRNVRTVALAANAGPAAARNAGAAAARGCLLLFLDSDGAASQGWLDAMLAAAVPGRVLLGCAVDYDGGRVQSLPRRATFLGKSLKARPERANTGPSCNLGFPKALFDALGGFDESIPYYFEDSDLCIRARRAGATFRYVPEAVFRHKGAEHKSGDAIRMQEHNSTFAMLKGYRGRPLSWTAFAVLNAAWMGARLCLWGLRGRFSDCRRLAAGWASAHARYFREG